MSTKEAKRYDRGVWLLEVASLQKLRQQLLAAVHGTVLEIGMGTGVNLPIYNGVSFVAGIDLRPQVLSGALTRENTPPFGVSCANAHHLPFGNGRFDNIVSTLAFCSISEPPLALAEIRRVLKPNGRFYLLEHVRGQNPVSQRLTDWLQPAWFALQHECHLNRETAVTLQASGFTIEESSTHGFGILQMMVAKIKIEE
ncbi:MAG: class I SAM-dependent methyltransferase [Anaerolineae bacterium]|nr:class I SAM-dependent methyltransferase [Anaerolineae bacterium]